jgi:hypothetical protein
MLSEEAAQDQIINHNQPSKQSYLILKIKHYQAWTYGYSFVIACVLNPMAGYEIAAYVHSPSDVIIGVILFAAIFMISNIIMTIKDHQSQRFIQQDKMAESKLSQMAHRYWVLIYAYSIIISCVLNLLLGYELATKFSLSAGLTIGIISFLISITLNVVVADYQHSQEIEPSPRCS